MAAGAAVIAANTSSLPEVVGEDDALFDPFNVEDISAKLEHVLTDQAFAQRLRAHGSVQSAKFSWQHTADQALHFLSRRWLLIRSAQLSEMSRPLGSLGRRNTPSD